jgi:hypothetical protein
MVRPLLAELVSYSKYHFSTEQNLMRLHRCPGTDEHVAAHDEFTAKIHRLEHVLEAEGGEAAALESRLGAGPLEAVTVAPKKTGIAVQLVALTWVPSWEDGSGSRTPAV